MPPRHPAALTGHGNQDGDLDGRVPAPGPLRPPGVRRRLLGLGASAVVLALVVGIPAALVAVAGNPLPASAPSPGQVWAALTRPDDGSLFLQALAFLGWVAWAAFALPVVLEVTAALTDHPVPHLPALGLQQRAAKGLVATAALLFTAVPVASATPPTTAAPPPAPLAATASAAGPAQQAPSPPAAGGVDRAQAPDQPTGPRAAQRAYQVRHGDSLWSIAAAQLGDGTRFDEITALNYGRTQPDGRALGRDHWIRPGWTLLLPAPAPSPTASPTADASTVGEGSRTGAPGGGATHPAGTPYQVRRGDSLWSIAAAHLGDGERFPDIVRASAATTQAGGEHLGDPDLLQPGWTLTIPDEHPPGPAAAPPPPAPGTAAPEATTPGMASPQGPTTAPTPPTPPTEWTAEPTTGAAPPAAPTPTPTPTAPTPAAPAASAPGRAGDHSDGQGGGDGLGADWGLGARTGAGVGAVLAAGVLGLLGARRSAQQRRRRAGAALPMPAGEGADVEHELRAAADPMTAQTVDVALRTLAARCEQDQRPLPVVRAARLTPEHLELYLAEPAHLPEPWHGTVDAAVWTLPADAHGLLEPAQARQVPAPYPSLVTIGRDSEDGHVLLDLEHLGALGVTGAPEAVQEVLAAVTIELATSSWADDLQVTVVGAFPELEDTLRSGRIRYLPAVGRLLQELGERVTSDRDALRAEGVEDLPHARAAHTAPDTWTPEIIVLAGQVTDHQRTELGEVLAGLPRVAIAVVTSGPPLGEWVIHLDDDQPDHAVLDPIGLALRPQRLDARTYAQLLDVLAITDEDAPAGDEDTLPSDHHQGAAGAPGYSVHLVPAGPVHVTDLPDPHDASRPTEPHDGAGPGRSGPGEVPGDRPADDRPGDLTDDPAPGPASAPPTRAGAHAAGWDRGPGLTAAAPTDAPAPTDVPRPAAVPAWPAGATPAAAHGAPVGDQPDDTDPPHTGDGGRGVTPAPGVPGSGTGDHLPRPGDGAHDMDGGTAGDAAGEAAAADGQESVGQGGEAGPAGHVARPAPRILLLGTVEVQGATGAVEPSKRNRLTELAAFLALNPGLGHAAVDAALWPGTPVSVNARNTAMSKLRRWLGKDAALGDHLPRYAAERGYQLAPAVRTDWQDWCELLPAGPARASTDALQRALALVRGRPFDAVNAHRYAWAEPVRQEMISAVVDAADELARRQLMEGRWRLAEQTVVTGLAVEPGMERLWRTRILAARASGNRDAEAEAIDRMTVIADELGGDLEDETLQLLADLDTTDVGSRRRLTSGVR